MKRGILPTVMLCHALLCVVLHAAMIPKSGEYPLLGDLEGHQSGPQVQFDKHGGAATWQSAGFDGSERILFQRLNSDGVGIGERYLVSQGQQGINDRAPQISLLSDGSSFVVWESGDRESPDVYFRIMSVNGQPITPILRVNTYTAGIQAEADVTVLDNDEVWVTWSSVGQGGGAKSIYAQKYDSSGQSMGKELRISSSVAGGQADPVIIPANHGGAWVAWSGEIVNGRNSSGGPDRRRNIYGKMLDAQGNWGSEFKINEGNVIAGQVRLEPLADGGFIAVWSQENEENSLNGTDVFARIFNAAGLPQSPAQRMNTYLPGDQENPVVAVVGEAMMVVWESSGQDDGGLGVRGRLYKGGVEFQVNAQGRWDQSMPSLAAAVSGQSFNILAVWANTIRPDKSILSAQRYKILGSGQNIGDASDVTSGEVVVTGEEATRRTVDSSFTKARKPTPRAPQGSETNPLVATFEIDEKSVGNAEAKVETVAPSRSVTVPLEVTSESQRTVTDSTEGKKSGSSVESANVTKRIESPPVPSASVAAQTAMATFTRIRAGESARSQMSGARSYISPVRQYASTKAPITRTGVSPTRSGMILGSTFSGGRLDRSSHVKKSTLRITSSSENNSQPIETVKLGGGSSRSISETTAQQRAASIKIDANKNAVMANNTSNMAVPAGISRTARGTQLKWVSQFGYRYQVQYSEDKVSWDNFEGIRDGLNGVDSMNMAPINARYFRVIKVN